jgi:hypothetical protein
MTLSPCMSCEWSAGEGGAVVTRSRADAMTQLRQQDSVDG